MSAESLTKINLAEFSAQEIRDLFASWNEPKFRAEQLIRWIWKENVRDFSHMTNLSKKLREKLESECEVAFPQIIHSEKSEDGTIKYLLSLKDGKTVESVWIPRVDQGRVTVCISTQVGCKMGCTFCLTAQQKVERNLKAGEIAAQLRVLPEFENISNVVVMGMGEPFDNYDHLMGALNLITSVDALNFGPRKITVSTSGLVPAIYRFVQESKCRLAISLNAPNDLIRSLIMPVNRAYNLDTLLGALKEISRFDFPKQLRDFSVTFEYILIKDLNDKPEHAKELLKRIRGIPNKVNILLYNENPNIPYKRPTDEAVAKFRAVLSKGGQLNFIRTSRGHDISAACGQLASEHKRQSLSH